VTTRRGRGESLPLRVRVNLPVPLKWDEMHAPLFRLVPLDVRQDWRNPQE